MTNQMALTLSPRKSASSARAYAPARATPVQTITRIKSSGGSMHLAAAGDRQRDARHVLGAAEVDRRVRDLLRRLLAAEVGEALHEVLEDALRRDIEHAGEDRVQDLGPHRGLDVARAERVD